MMCDICKEPFARDALTLVIPLSQALVHMWCYMLRLPETFGRN
jgi:hypothetical protein